MAPLRATAALAALAASFALQSEGASPKPVPRTIVLDRDDIDVTEDVVVKPGVHRVADARGDGVLRVKKDGVTVDFAGATLLGNREGVEADAFEGVGIAVLGHARVTIRNAKVHGFLVGIQALGCPKLRVEGCDVGGQRRMRLRSTPEREDAADWLWPHENDGAEWATRYGAGIWAKDCPDSDFVANRARASQNGLILDRCERVRVHDNDFSFLSGWGLAMWRSSRNEIAHNRFDWCVRGYSHGVYDRGQDSAGILVFEQCSDNVFAFNSATHGGDGFFLYAGNETLERTGKGGCNRNLVYGNDFSHAVANGIEATFSEGNVFAENRLDDCSQHGVWGGYSYDTTIVGNSIADAGGGGISIEHGHDNWIEKNTLRGNRIAVELWENESSSFAAKPYGRSQETASARTTVVRNHFEKNGQAVDVRRSAAVAVRENVFRDESRILRARGPCPGLVFDGNRISWPRALEYIVRNETGDDLPVGTNLPGRLDTANLLGPRVTSAPAAAAAIPLAPERVVARPKVGGTLDAALPARAPRGRRWILVDEWGPCDFESPKLVPREVHAFAEASFLVVGPPGGFEVVDASPGIQVEGRRGDVPGSVKVRQAPGGPDVAPFELRVKVSGFDTPLFFRGTIARTTWRVRHWAWSGGAPKTPPADWSAVIAAPPLAELQTDRLDFAWLGHAPADRVPADRFATVAETTIRLPAGRYEIRTTSDDGVRVVVDGKTVQEDWSWHPPKENVSALDLTEGEHRFRVEHFEIDGHAELRLQLRPAAGR